jgi:hypothetical protein
MVVRKNWRQVARIYILEFRLPPDDAWLVSSNVQPFVDLKYARYKKSELEKNKPEMYVKYRVATFVRSEKRKKRK